MFKMQQAENEKLAAFLADVVLLRTTQPSADVEYDYIVLFIMSTKY